MVSTCEELSFQVVNRFFSTFRFEELDLNEIKSFNENKIESSFVTFNYNADEAAQERLVFIFSSLVVLISNLNIIEGR